MNILIKFKNLLVESLIDNKKLIIGLYVIFIVIFILSWILSGPLVHSYLANTTYVPGGDYSGLTDSLDLFIHNEWSGIMTYVTSVFFAIPAIATSNELNSESG